MITIFKPTLENFISESTSSVYVQRIWRQVMDTKIYELVITGTNKENYVLKFLVRSLVEDEIKCHETKAIEILKKAKKKVLEGIISDEPIQGALIK